VNQAQENGRRIAERAQANTAVGGERQNSVPAIHDAPPQDLTKQQSNTEAAAAAEKLLMGGRERFLNEPDPRGPVIFSQSVQVLAEGGVPVVKQLELRRYVSPRETAFKFCRENNIGQNECPKLAEVLDQHLKRRMADEDRWSKYDGLGYIEMMMW